jgi:2-(1,2-epoxy-1,2-dihydrophenyl)acetyl-CoA isomerase
MKHTFGSVLYEHEDGIAVVTLNRTERCNALGGTLRENLVDAMALASADETVRAIVLTGAGSAFCAGGDLHEIHTRATQGQSLADKIEPARDRTLLAVYEASKPVIAAVNGAAMGAGMNLALAADIRIASRSAFFSQSHVRRGLMPDYGGTYLLPLAVGQSKAMELICTGAIVDAEEALHLRIVSQVVEPGELMNTAKALAHHIASNAPLPIRLAKRAVQQRQQGGIREALARETAAQNVCYGTRDGVEGLRAFLEKREPAFIGQ